MSTKETVLNILLEKNEKAISGEELAKKCNVSRAAIWKAITSLRNEGCIIEGTPNGGYLLQSADIFSKELFTKDFQDRFPSFKSSYIECFKTIDSTNSYAKRLLSDCGALRDINQNLTEAGKKLNNSIYIAESQTAGKGRSGRTFVSPLKTGIYITVVYAPQGGIKNAARITAFTGVAVCRAIKKLYNADPKIKWINDIFINGKKMCGILAEGMTNFENGTIESAVIGIGINIENNKEAFNSELKNIAGSIIQENQENNIPRYKLASEVAGQVLSILDQNPSEIIDEYKKLVFMLGQEVEVHSIIDNKAGNYKATAIDINEDAGLIVKLNDGSIKTLISGEVSLKSSNFTK